MVTKQEQLFYTCMHIRMCISIFQEPGRRVWWWRPSERRWLLKGMPAGGRLPLCRWVEEHPLGLCPTNQVFLCHISLSFWYPITYSRMLIIMTLDVSVVCQALAVWHIVLSMRRLNWGIESSNSLLSLIWDLNRGSEALESTCETAGLHHLLG